MEAGLPSGDAVTVIVKWRVSSMQRISRMAYSGDRGSVQVPWHYSIDCMHTVGVPD